MIFIIVGSQKFQFNRLLRAIDELIAKGKIRDEVFAQRGVSDYIPKNYGSKQFMDRDEFNDYVRKAQVVITHGGTGAIIGALKAGKSVIAIPRLAKYGEHVDDHQTQLIGEFTETGMIYGCESTDELGRLIDEAKKRKPICYISNTQRYLSEIDSYIQSLSDNRKL